MATKRLIDVNDALEMLEKAEQEMMVVSMVGCKAAPMHAVIEFIKTRPTVNAVEVVRCKDCEKWQRHTHVDRERGHCRRFDITKHESGFCDRGERKDND